MTDTICSQCAYSEMIHDNSVNAYRQWCASPQVQATGRGKARCNFERDSYSQEHNRDKPATRKCGPDALNYAMMQQ